MMTTGTVNIVTAFLESGGSNLVTNTTGTGKTMRDFKSVQCGCLGTGAAASYSSDGSFDVIECEFCAGQGFYYIDDKGRCRDRFGRFRG